MKKSLLMLCVAMIFMTIPAVAQNIQIRGKVIDADTMLDISGASVHVKGTTTGTITDLNGVFEISAPAGSTIVVSAIGYESQEQHVEGNRLFFILWPSSELLFNNTKITSQQTTYSYNYPNKK